MTRTNPKKILILVLFFVAQISSIGAVHNEEVQTENSAAIGKNGIGVSLYRYLGSAVFFLNPHWNISYDRIIGNFGIDLSLSRSLDRYWDENGYDSEYFHVYFDLKPSVYLIKCKLTENWSFLFYTFGILQFTSGYCPETEEFPFDELKLELVNTKYGIGSVFIKRKHESFYIDLGLGNFIGKEYKQDEGFTFKVNPSSYWRLHLDFGVKIRF